MKISVRSGDVQVRSVQVFLHSRGIYSVEVKTPFEPRVALVFGQLAEKSTGICTTVDIYAPLRDEATRVTLIPENPNEKIALFGSLSYETGSGGFTLVQAIPKHVRDRRGGLVASWELPSARVDYLEGEY